MKKQLSAGKAREMLEDGTVHGKPITKKQRGFFGAVAGDNSRKLRYKKPVYVRDAYR